MDAWDTEGELEHELNRPIRDLVEIDPYKKTEDDRGHGVTLAARVTRSVEREVIKLAELPGGPYSIKSDVVRDAVFIGLIVLALRYKLHDWQIKGDMARVSSATGEASRIREDVGELVESLRKLSYERGGKVKAKEFLSKYVNHIDSLQDDWVKSKYKDVLNEHGIINELLDGLQKV